MGLLQVIVCLVNNGKRENLIPAVDGVVLSLESK